LQRFLMVQNAVKLFPSAGYVRVPAPQGGNQDPEEPFPMMPVETPDVVAKMSKPELLAASQAHFILIMSKPRQWKSY
jgi:hypothetical protein